ncbi:hypothetical protein AK37_09092 [Rhodococcus pyridinivorans AK37]|uniref:Uncharacterized protein n=1 Tax=Rhodococcus pyridinivorans AK37 TaxID=1114960 RepID=H0JPZ9_9NOCA|nr:hypothetical protein AK37_09092 [Rhodococcus pyridinivorans AK37]
MDVCGGSAGGGSDRGDGSDRRPILSSSSATVSCSGSSESAARRLRALSWRRESGSVSSERCTPPERLRRDERDSR